MRLDKSGLLDFLEEASRALPKRVTLVAVGGTAMTLLGFKSSTIDIDFTGPAADVRLFEKALKSIPHGFKIDLFMGGMVFCVELPDDYLVKSRPAGRAGKVSLRALQPLDIVVTKVARLDLRDEQDIRECIRRAGLRHGDIVARAAECGYAGDELLYAHNLSLVKGKFFD